VRWRAETHRRRSEIARAHIGHHGGTGTMLRWWWLHLMVVVTQGHVVLMIGWQRSAQRHGACSTILVCCSGADDTGAT